MAVQDASKVDAARENGVDNELVKQIVDTYTAAVAKAVSIEKTMKNMESDWPNGPRWAADVADTSEERATGGKIGFAAGLLLAYFFLRSRKQAEKEGLAR